MSNQHEMMRQVEMRQEHNIKETKRRTETDAKNPIIFTRVYL